VHHQHNADDADSKVRYTRKMDCQISEVARVFGELFHGDKSELVLSEKWSKDWSKAYKLCTPANKHFPINQKYFEQELGEKLDALILNAAKSYKNKGRKNYFRDTAHLKAGLILMHRRIRFPPLPDSFSKHKLFQRLNAACRLVDKSLGSPRPFSKTRIRKSVLLSLETFQEFERKEKFDELIFFRIPAESLSLLSQASQSQVNSRNDVAYLYKTIFKAREFLRNSLLKELAPTFSSILKPLRTIETREHIHLFAKAALLDFFKSKIQPEKWQELKLNPFDSYSLLQANFQKYRLNPDFAFQWKNMESLRRAIDAAYRTRQPNLK